MSSVRLSNLRWTDWLFTVLMLALACTCFFLGGWQLDRLGEKEALIAAVDSRLDATPVPVADAADWAGLDTDAEIFKPVSLTGHYRYNQTVTVFTSLSDPKGRYGGPGYWVMTPFVLDAGGTVFVNRGFVPQDAQEAAILSQFDAAAGETITISGLYRPSEAAGFMTPGVDMSDRIAWVRDTSVLASMVDPELAPIAPFYVDLRASAPGELPQAGETVVEFPNNHLGYAYTWYGFSIVAIVMLGFWIWRQAQRAPKS